MPAHATHRSAAETEGGGPGARMLLLLLPLTLLLIAALRQPGSKNVMLWGGCAFQGIVCALTFATRNRRQAMGPAVITLYLIALGWLWFSDTQTDWYTQLSKAILLLVPLAVFGLQTLSESGAPAMRRARRLCDGLAHRKDWPEDLANCRTLPEVKALRAALHLDAAPALALLSHARPEVRVAALAALEFRKDWKPGQAEVVLQLAQRTEVPAVRAGAVTALGNIDDRAMVETLAQFLHDPSVEVRQAATEALLWDTDNRWGWIRFAVRRFLADPIYSNDGPLKELGQMLTIEAVKDLTAWSAEKGLVASRAAQTLAAHYTRAVAEGADDGIIRSLKAQVANVHTPAVLRIELGRLLQYNHELDPPLLAKMLDSASPAPLRLIACETILIDNIEGPLKTAAAAALRDLARLPNREIALATADVIQRRLGVDLGLGLGQPLPPVHSRQAADITRRVMAWAASHEPCEDVDNSAPLPPQESLL